VMQGARCWLVQGARCWLVQGARCWLVQGERCWLVQVEHSMVRAAGGWVVETHWKEEREHYLETRRH
jgi:hypothetical protein